MVLRLGEALAGRTETDERTLARLLHRLVDDLRATPVRPEQVR